MRAEVAVLVTVLTLLSFVHVLSVTAKGAKPEATSFQLRPVGRVEIRGGETGVRIAPKYADALHGLEGFSHVWVFYWFDRNDTPQKRSTLKVHPRGNPRNPLTGVFATRSPARPNLIALTLCRVLSVKGTCLRIDAIDALDGSPVLDLKPYIPTIDARHDAKVPAWVQG